MFRARGGGGTLALKQEGGRGYSIPPPKWDVPIRAQFRLRLPSFSGPLTMFRGKTTVFRYNLHSYTSENHDTI